MCAHPKQGSSASSEQRPILANTQKEASILWIEQAIAIGCKKPPLRAVHSTNVAKQRSRRSLSYGTMTAAEKEKEAHASAIKSASAGNGSDDDQVPDGGWGWLVVLGVSLSNMTTQALVSVFGFLFSERFRELGIETGGAALILSVQSSVLNLSGLFTGALIRAFSYQKIAITGALLMVTGLLLTLLADSLITYVLTYGVFTGLGLGFLYPSTFVAVNSYFDKKRGIAVGWSVTGTGVGQMLLPLLVSYLLDEFGFKGSILILAGISAHSLVAALLYQPVSWHTKKPKKSPSASQMKMTGNGDVKISMTPAAEVEKTSETASRTVADNFSEGVQGLAIRPLPDPRIISVSTPSLYSVELDQNDREIRPVAKLEKGKLVKEKTVDDNVGCWSKAMTTLDYDLLKNGPFLSVVIGCGIIYTANTSFQMLYPLYLENLMYTRQEVASCMVTLSAFDIVGRPVLPYIVSLLKMRAKTILFVAALLSAIIRSGVATQSKMLPILILSAVCGLFRSAIITNMNLSIAEQTSRPKVPAALGLQMVSKGIVSMALGPVIGIIRDETHSFSLCIHILSFFFLFLPFLTYLVERLYCTPKSPS